MTPRMSNLLLVALLSLFVLGAAPLPQPTPPPAEEPGPTPSPEPEPSTNVVQQVIHRLLFPAETIGQALTNVFNQAAGREAENLSRGSAEKPVGENVVPTTAMLAPDLVDLNGDRKSVV